MGDLGESPLVTQLEAPETSASHQSSCEGALTVVTVDDPHQRRHDHPSQAADRLPLHPRERGPAADVCHDTTPRHPQRHVSPASGHGYGRDRLASIVREPERVSNQRAGEHHYRHITLGEPTIDNRLVVVIIMAVDATQPTRVIAAAKPMRLLVVASSGTLMDHGRDDILLCTL